jgi:GrpB-like predicted nucleotidyltransferase (UPF0157 family)/8-oxo-dGTP pyrophosphatase MutT (NUDIX family)
MEGQPRKTELAAYLARHTAGAEEEALWLNGAIRLRIRCYLSDEAPPSEYIASARSVVWRGSEVLTVRNPHEWHVLPGGRREGTETPERALRREVLEETGVHIERPLRLGFVHLHHLTPKPPDYEFLFPDFLWAVYLSEAGPVKLDHVRQPDEYEEEALFRSVEDASALALSTESMFFLTATDGIRKRQTPVVVVPYDPSWPAMFERERVAIMSALANLDVAIEHNGSTAVPGLVAKPKIDILVGLRTWDNLGTAVGALLSLGYEHERQLIRPRTFSVKRGRPTTHRVRFVEQGGVLWSENLAFRDALRADPGLAARYGQLKQDLAQRYADDLSHEGYMSGKAPFIHAALAAVRGTSVQNRDVTRSR